ncbi:hypothetical protein Tco_0437880 [Tanacetum coccineum]
MCNAPIMCHLLLNQDLLHHIRRENPAKNQFATNVGEVGTGEELSSCNSPRLMKKEEADLGDLGEPANYRAALLDHPESKKWLDVMNVEMQSMKDNDVWALVKLPPKASDVAYILGIKIYRDRSKRLIDLCQSAYIEKILKRYSMENSKHGTIPMQEKLTLSKSQEPEVSCYTDAEYLTDADTLRWQTGYVFVLNGGAVDWKSTKQSIFATSSTDTGYIAAFDASKEAVWIWKFISRLGIVPTIEEPINDYISRKQFDKENYPEHPIPEAPIAPPGQQVPPAAAAAHAAWVKGQKEVAVIMLLTMDIENQRNLAHLGAYDMLQELKALYSKQAEQELL